MSTSQESSRRATLRGPKWHVCWPVIARSDRQNTAKRLSGSRGNGPRLPPATVAQRPFGGGGQVAGALFEVLNKDNQDTTKIYHPKTRFGSDRRKGKNNGVKEVGSQPSVDYTGILQDLRLKSLNAAKRRNM